MKRLLFLLAFAGLVAAACGPEPLATNEPTPVPPTASAPTVPPPTATPAPVNLTPAQKNAIQALAAALGIAVDQIKIISAEAVEWPDGCLGVSRSDMMCIQVITPGFRIVLEANGQQYEYHTNRDGSAVMLATEGALAAGNKPQQAAVRALAASLGIPVDQIKIISAEAVEWPDGCLGVSRSDMMCIQVIMPGFRIVLEANGQQYEYHTNRDGSAVALATEGAPVTGDKPEQAAVHTLAASLGLTPGDIKVVSSQFVEWPDACLGVAPPGTVCAQVLTPGYLIVLEARGRQYEYHTNLGGNLVVPAAIALTWHREGGIAGFCDNLTVYASGEAQASGCGPNAQPAADVLSPDERAQLDQWLAAFGAVMVTHADPATADAMKTTLALSGAGAGQPTEADRQAMLVWAEALYARLQP